MREHLFKRGKGNGDYLLIVAVVLLSIIGAIFIYSASRYSAKATYGDEFYFVKKQFIGFVLGIAAMLICARFDYRILKGKPTNGRRNFRYRDHHSYR